MADICSATMGLVNWFRAHDIEPPTVIRLRDKEAGIRFAHAIERELALTGLDVRLHWKPDISFVDIAGVRFVWPFDDA